MRLQNWDYSSEGVYFITICCNDHQSFFGLVKDKKVILSEIGKIASQYWLNIPIHFPHVKVDEFVIMPNHTHGILMVDYSLVKIRREVVITENPNKNHNSNQFSKPVKNSISIIINQYKSSVKRWCNQNGFNYFQWQPLFYDEILTNEISIDIIRGYIFNNPKNWSEDDYYKC
jgi:putative transposase